MNNRISKSVSIAANHSLAKQFFIDYEGKVPVVLALPEHAHEHEEENTKYMAV